MRLALSQRGSRSYPGQRTPYTSTPLRRPGAWGLGPSRESPMRGAWSNSSSKWLTPSRVLSRSTCGSWCAPSLPAWRLLCAVTAGTQAINRCGGPLHKRRNFVAHEYRTGCVASRGISPRTRVDQVPRLMYALLCSTGSCSEHGSDAPKWVSDHAGGGPGVPSLEEEFPATGKWLRARVLYQERDMCGADPE